MRRFISFLIVLTMVIGMLCACSRSNSDQAPTSAHAQTTLPNDTTTSENTAPPTTLPQETAPQAQGKYSLSDCASYNGLYIHYNDDSFDRYPTGGYCPNLSEGYHAMFIANSIVDEIPTITPDDSVVVFADTNYSVYAFPIAAQVPTIYTYSDDGYAVYGKPYYSYTYGYAYIDMYYSNNESGRLDFQTINSQNPSDYNYEVVRWTVNPYAGMKSSEESYSITGFQKNTSVTLGVINGTTVTETLYNVGATYYAFSSNMNNWDEEDVYYPQKTPTTQGYATLDFSEIPSGQYVFIFECNRRYFATLLNWQNF